MSLHSVTTALNGMGPLPVDSDESYDAAGGRYGVDGLLVSAFELRYSLFRGEFLTSYFGVICKLDYYLGINTHSFQLCLITLLC